MKTYYDERKHASYTEARLKQLGFPNEDALLLKIGVYPITYNYPSYNADEQRIEPLGELSKSADGLSYTQKFAVVDLPSDEVSTKEDTKRKEAAKEELASIDAETSRPLRAWVNGTADEFDLKKLYELECRAKKARAVLQGKPEPECPPYTPGIIPAGPQTRPVEVEVEGTPEVAIPTNVDATSETQV